MTGVFDGLPSRARLLRACPRRLNHDHGCGELTGPDGVLEDRLRTVLAYGGSARWPRFKPCLQQAESVCDRADHGVAREINADEVHRRVALGPSNIQELADGEANRHSTREGDTARGEDSGKANTCGCSHDGGGQRGDERCEYHKSEQQCPAVSPSLGGSR